MNLLRTGTVLLAALALSVAAQENSDRPGKWDAITDVPGVRVGHYTVNEGTLRGVTAILFDKAGICGLDVRGGNPVTLEDSTFSPVAVGGECHAVVFSGGSVFGLATESGVVDFLFEHGVGVQTGAGVVPLVPAAVIYDLPMDNAKIRPTRDWGYAAAKAASYGTRDAGKRGSRRGSHHWQACGRDSYQRRTR